MKKITAIIGSPHQEKSNTIALATDFLEMVRLKNPEVDYEVISLGACNIAPCRGCWGCTRSGECCLQDDLQLVQAKLLASDMVLLGSPVYVDHISSQLKAFIDRSFIWLHTLKLIGKPSMTVLTTAGSGIGECEKYLNKVLYLLGTIPVGHLHGTAFRPGEFPNREACRKKYESLAGKTAAILDGKRNLRPHLMNELCYWAMKSKASFGASYLPYENTYWKESGWSKLSYAGAVKKSRELLQSGNTVVA